MNIGALIVSAAVQSSVSVLVGLYWRRAIRLNNVRIEQILTGVEGVVLTQGKGMRMNLREYRKAIALVGGTVLTGLLTWAETADLEPVIGPLIPTEFRPLVGVFLGGIASLAAVILAKNEQPAGDASSVPASPAAPVVAQSASIGRFAEPVPFWNGVVASGETAPTSVVQLQPVPTSSPL